MNCARKKLRISVKKHENLSVKTRTCFFKKSYVFWMKLVRVFPNLSAENKSAYRNRQEAIITCISPVFYLISRNDNQADKMKIIADNTVPYLKGILEPIADVSYLDSKEFTPTNIKDADALIVRSIDKCTRELLEGSRVRLITTATIGYDHIDIHYCEKTGITWKNAPGCNAASVGQYVLSSLVAVALRKGERLAGKTIGIVGVGHVGSIVEMLCEAMGMRVLRNDPPRAEQEGEDGFVSLDTIAKEADIITLHVPLTKEGRFATRHLADHAFFDRLERKPWFINSCRGAVHDTQALLQAKRTGKVSELIIDCWENEPDIDHDRHSSYSRFLRRREGERDTNVPREYRMLFRYPYRKDQGSHSTCPNQPVHRLGTIQGAPGGRSHLEKFQPRSNRPSTKSESSSFRAI